MLLRSDKDPRCNAGISRSSPGYWFIPAVQPFKKTFYWCITLVCLPLYKFMNSLPPKEKHVHFRHGKKIIWYVPSLLFLKINKHDLARFKQIPNYQFTNKTPGFITEDPHRGGCTRLYLFNISNSNLLLEKQRLLTTLFHSSIKSSLLTNINLKTLL